MSRERTVSAKAVRLVVAAMAVGVLFLAGCREMCGCGGSHKVTDGRKAVRINAGGTSPVTDAEGNVWLPDAGFVGGDVVDRGERPIANTKNPAIYRTEHYSMTAFSHQVPNGNYVVKLHFAETWDGIYNAGERVFICDVEGNEVKVDPWADSGGFEKAVVKTVKVAVSDGKLDIAFKPTVHEPEINGIEIIPIPPR